MSSTTPWAAHFGPADGVVGLPGLVDGVPDNIPGVMNPEQPLGNYVVLDHQNGEYPF